MKLLHWLQQRTKRWWWLPCIAIESPIEGETANTDWDSDASYNEVTCNPDHIVSSRRILLTNTVPEVEEADMLTRKEGTVTKQKLLIL